MPDAPQAPVGVILAGGRGQRIGGAKATIGLAGRPLISYPLAAMQAAMGEVAVVAKSDTPLPPLSQVPIWTEPAQPEHPLLGIVTALRRAAGRAVLVCAVDMPFISPGLLRALAVAPSGQAPAVVAACAGALTPTLGRYEPAALAMLEASAAEARAPLRAVVVQTLAPARFEVADSGELFNVNTPQDLVEAERMLRASRR
ncbi:MAG: molybdenum cofactor guanylyltransferase [Actinomycetota bacterium]|nr:molybdenum cofactor guanylyltransferase [Actinomycetota bacterium]